MIVMCITMVCSRLHQSSKALNSDASPFGLEQLKQAAEVRRIMRQICNPYAHLGIDLLDEVGVVLLVRLQDLVRGAALRDQSTLL